MKNFTILIFLLFVSFLGHSQTDARVLVEGQVIVPQQDDPDGIVIFNETSQRGTITNTKGMFKLSVAPQDRVIVQSLQFNPITIIVNQSILDSQQMVITLQESIEELETVVVNPNELTGNITVDVNRVPTRDSIDEIDPATIRMENSIYDGQGVPDNVALDNQRWRYGLNFVNIFKTLVGKKKSSTSEEELTRAEKLESLYNDQFFKKNLDIQESLVPEFIAYVQEKGLTDEMLAPGNELNLIQFLIEKRNAFKNR